MARKLAVALALLSTFLALPARSTEATPPECEDARLLAQAMFQSDAPRLYAPLHLPADMRSELILGAADLDISGGNALTASSAFDKLPLPTGRSVYWLRTPGEGQQRIAVAERSAGWRGDMYSLYLFDQGFAPAAFMDALGSGSRGVDAKSVVSGSWRPPLVFQLPDAPGQWFIDVGQPFEALARWTVYATDAAGPVCGIAFGGEPGSHDRLLPAEVHALSRLLDEALGPGNDEGTLQPTAALRIEAAHVRANATFRPWALARATPYNSRAEVDAGLEEWARGVRSRRGLLAKINASYAPAQRSLAKFYERTFGLTGADAEKVAAWALDIIFRSYFVFPRAGEAPQGDGGDRNPWPREAGRPVGSASGVHLQAGAERR